MDYLLVPAAVAAGPLPQGGPPLLTQRAEYLKRGARPALRSARTGRQIQSRPALGARSGLIFAADYDRCVYALNYSTGARKWPGFWCYHSSRINGLAFSPNSQFVASAGLDSHVYIWNTKKGMKRFQLKFAHKHGVNCGADGCIKSWKVTLPGV